MSEILKKLIKMNVISIREYLGEYLEKKMKDKWFIQETLWKKIWKTWAYINQLIKWKTWTSGVYIWLFQLLWATETEIVNLYKTSINESNNNTFGSNFNTIPNGKINTLDDIEFENEELLKVMFKREFWKELSNDDKEEILNFIKFKASK